MKIHFACAFALGAAALVAMTAAGCSKSPSGPAQQETKLRQKWPVPANMTVKELGVVEFSPHTPKRVSLGDGRDCVLTPTGLADGNLQVDLVVETKVSDGKTERLQSRLITPPGMPCAISVGSSMVSLTPKLKPE
jgi:hypothetical protein